MPAASVCIHVGPSRVRIGCPILSPQAEKHQFGAVGELQAEPVPTGVACFKLMGEKLVIHPRETFHLEYGSLNLDGAPRREPGQ